MVGTQYQADVPSCLSHYKDGEKGNAPCAWNLFWLVPFWCWLCLFCVSYHPAYEEDDQLLWSPGVIPESKVRSFLLDVLSRTTDEKLGCDKPAVHLRDNEQVCNDSIPSFAVLYTAEAFSVLIFYWLLVVTYSSQLCDWLDCILPLIHDAPIP